MITPNIRLYIDSDWMTVPYDSILYNEDGKKVTTPMVKWKDYRYDKNEKASAAGAVICGERSDICVLDCDDQEAAQNIINVAKWPDIHSVNDILKDPEHAAEHIGLVVQTGRGWHFYFKYEATVADAKGPKLDVQATDNKLIYLATTEEASEGKSIIAMNKVYDDCNKIILHSMPEVLREYCVSLQSGKEEINARKKVRFQGGIPLAKIPMDSDSYLKRVVPSYCRAIPEYRAIIDKRGFIKPDDIKDGDGNDYIIAMCGVFASDPTIDYDEFFKHMHHINSMWSDPYTVEALEATIAPYADGKYEGCPFNYDDDWEKSAYSFIDVDGHGITLALDLMSGKFIVGHGDSGKVMMKSAQEVGIFYANRTGVKAAANTIASFVPGVKADFLPTEPFGLSEEGVFNVYKHSKYLDILNDKAAVFTDAEKKAASEGQILKFFEHLFGEQAEYFMQFLKRKLTTFDYSPIIFCLFDKRGGAGKGALQSLLNSFVGEARVGALKESAFKAKFTGEYENKLFVFHNEYSDEPRQRTENTDAWKDMSGSSVVPIERKGSDAYNVANYFTMFVTSNKISVELKDGDRRFLVSNCTKTFDSEFGGSSFFTDVLNTEEQLSLLAIHLKCNVKMLSDKDYFRPPMTVMKENFQELTLTRPDALAKAIEEKDWFTIREIGGMKSLLIAHDVLDLTALCDYAELNIKSINRALKLGVSEEYQAKKDTNRKYRTDKYIQYIKFPSGTMERLHIEEAETDKKATDGDTVVQPKI